MTVMTEGNLQLTANDAISARKFDDAEHGLSHCMKAVDFIIELSDRYLFVEFKDPQNPGAPEGTDENYLANFTSGRMDDDLKYKLRDTFLYEWASGRADKPVDYFILIALDALADPILVSRGKDMERKLPVLGPGGQPWHQPIVRSCAVFNMDSWNRNLPHFPVSRIATTHPC